MRLRGSSCAALVLRACLPLAAIQPLLAAEEPRQPTIGDLKPRAVEVRPDEPVDASTAKAMESYRRFLELQTADPQLRAEALRRLGDLSLEAGESERIDTEVSALDLQGAEAIRLYSALLQAFPSYPRNDQVLYQLARAYETTGQPEQALATLDRIVQHYPQSTQTDEVQFRRGELLFSAARYAEAEKAYAVVVRRGRSSPFYVQSLYKHGWSLFKQSLNEESLPSFASLLEEKLVSGGGQKVLRLEELTRADRELIEDTLRVMSISFSEGEGAEMLGDFVSRRGNVPHAHLLYSYLGDLYVEKQRFQDAAATYRAYVAREPNSDHAPHLAMQAIEAYRQGGFDQLVLEGKREFVERYNFDTPFWQSRAPGNFASVVRELKTSLKDVATHHHAAAQASKQIEDYEQAARWYRDYLRWFPDDPESAATHYLLAETLFESRQYAQASEEYERTAYDYPRNEKSAAAAYAALVAYEREEERLSGSAKAKWHDRAVDANVRFALNFPGHPDSAGVLTRAAQDIFESRDLPRAMKVAQLILDRNPPADAPMRRIAWTIIGQSHFDLGALDEAERAFLQARELAAADEAIRTDLGERVAATIYRQAEAKQTAGDAVGAVDDFLRVARMAPEAKIRSTAQYDAAAQLIRLEQWERAIAVLEEFRREFPKHELSPEVTRNLAVAYEKIDRPAHAAVEFERIAANQAEDPAVRREALLQAADLYEQAQDVDKAVSVLERFVAAHPTPVAESVEIRQRLADFAAAKGDIARQKHWHREIIEADAQAGAQRTDRTRYLAAKAQLSLAHPARDAFRDIRLVAPLRRSLTAKRKALEAALAGYKLAADYRIAEITTAATFEMADLYRTLGRDLLKSERPRGLSAEELEEYDLLLEEQAYPFEEQAIAMHEVNTARTRDGIYDEWVRRSFAALADIKPARYAKTELTLDGVVAPGETGVAPAASERDLADTATDPARLAHAPVPDSGLATGIRHRAAGRIEQAEQALRELLERDAANVAAWNELGVTLRMRGRFHEALEAYERAIASDSGYAATHRNKGVLLDLYLDDPQAALMAFEQYRDLTGEERPVTTWIAELRQRTGQKETRTEAASPEAAAPAEDEPPVEKTAPAERESPVTDAAAGEP